MYASPSPHSNPEVMQHVRADICLLDARLRSRESPFHFQLRHICSKACEACDNMAASGSGIDQELLQDCAAACHRCADSCRQMAIMYKSDEMH